MAAPRPFPRSRRRRVDATQRVIARRRRGVSESVERPPSVEVPTGEIHLSRAAWKSIATPSCRRRRTGEIHFIVAACENMISGEAVRPGDVLTASNGKTIEVANTDAEGRLTLADALVYAEKLKPRLLSISRR